MLLAFFAVWFMCFDHAQCLWRVTPSSRVNNEGSVTNLMQTSFYGLLWYLRVFEAK